MPRDQRPNKNYRAPKGRLNSLASAYFGGPPGSLGSAGDLEGPTESGQTYDAAELGTNNNEPSISGEPPSVSGLSVPQYQKPGWMSNILSGGRAGQSYNAMAGRTALDAYNNQAKEILQQQAKQAAMDQLAAKGQSEMDLLKTRVPLEEASNIRVNVAKNQGDIAANLAKVADSYGFTPDELHQYLGEASRQKLMGEAQQQQLINSVMGTPDGGTAVVNNWYSQMGKQAGDNSLNAANASKAIADSQSMLAKIPSERFLKLPSGDSAVDPLTGRAYFNAPSSIQPFEVKGGPTMTPMVPGYSAAGGPRKAPGGIAGELSIGNGGGPTSTGFSPLPNSQQSSSLPYFAPPPQPTNSYPAAYQPYANSLPQQPSAPIVPQPSYPTNSSLPDTNTIINSAITEYLRRLKFPNGFPQ